MSTESKKQDNNYCTKCGGFVEYDKSEVLCSSPPQYSGRCTGCGSREYTECSDVDCGSNYDIEYIKNNKNCFDI